MLPVSSTCQPAGFVWREQTELCSTQPEFTCGLCSTCPRTWAPGSCFRLWLLRTGRTRAPNPQGAGLGHRPSHGKAGPCCRKSMARHLSFRGCPQDNAAYLFLYILTYRVKLSQKEKSDYRILTCRYAI